MIVPQSILLTLLALSCGAGVLVMAVDNRRHPLLAWLAVTVTVLGFVAAFAGIVAYYALTRQVAR